MARKQQLALDYDLLEKFLSKPYNERGKNFDIFMNRKFVMTERVGDIRDYCLTYNKKFYQSKDFRDVVYLPFEKIEIPAPVGFEDCLTSAFGDWRKPVFYPSHAKVYSTDFSYKEFFKSVKFV